jgi:hypothetical protein
MGFGYYDWGAKHKLYDSFGKWGGPGVLPLIEIRASV